jgi:hypothetical protein
VAALLFVGKIRLLVARLDVQAIGNDPDLQQMHHLSRRRVELAVADAAAGAHHLHVARADDRTVTHRVAVFERAGKDVGEDLHVLVRMRVEALAGLNDVIVDHPQVGETHLLRIVIAGEGKGVRV